MILHPLIFTLKLCLQLKWVSCKQHIDGACSLIHSVRLCLLIGALSPLTCKVSTERYEFMAIIFFEELEKKNLYIFVSISTSTSIYLFISIYHLMGVLGASWILMAVSFPRLAKFSTMICSHNPAAPISLSSSSGPL